MIKNILGRIKKALKKIKNTLNTVDAFFERNTTRPIFKKLFPFVIPGFCLILLIVDHPNYQLTYSEFCQFFYDHFLLITFIFFCIALYFHYKAILELFAILIAVGALSMQFESSKDQANINAWQILGTRASGNSGKKEALEFLAKQKVSLSEVDMSAKANGGYLDRQNEEWKGRVYLVGLNLSNLKADLIQSDFEGSNLLMANFEGAILSGANFKDTSLIKASFKKAYLLATNFEEVDLSDVNFEETEEFDSATFKNSYIRNPNNYELPKAPIGYKFKLDHRINGYKHYIKLIKTNS